MSIAHFVERAKAKHGDRFNYSGIQYLGFDKPIQIVCSRHGAFWTTPKSHVYAASGGCPECRGILMGQAHRYTTDQFVELARKIHGE